MNMRRKKDSDYNVHTGHRKREYYWECEKITVWGRMFGTLHDEKLVIEDPEKMIGKYKYRGVLTIWRIGI